MLDLILAAALIQTPNPCHALEAPPAGAGCPQWRVLWRGNRGALSADPASLRRDGAAFEIRIRFVYDETFADGTRSITSTMRMECVARTGARRNGAAYATDGTLRFEEDRAAAPVLRSVAAGGPEDALLTEYCLR